MKRIKIHKAYFITWLFIFYVIFANAEQLTTFFMATVIFSSAIVGFLAVGTLYQLVSGFDIMMLGGTFGALAYKRTGYEFYIRSINAILPANIAYMLETRKNQQKMLFTQEESRDIIDWLETKFIKQKSYINFFINTSMLIGLLGTFVGLVESIDKMGQIILSLNGDVDIKDIMQQFSGPLSGMAIGFGASLFGVVTAVILGLNGYILFRYQDTLIIGIEEWLKDRIIDIAPSEGSANATVDSDSVGHRKSFMDLFLEQISTLTKEISNISKTNENFNNMSLSLSNIELAMNEQKTVFKEMLDLQTKSSLQSELLLSSILDTQREITKTNSTEFARLVEATHELKLLSQESNKSADATTRLQKELYEQDTNFQSKALSLLGAANDLLTADRQVSKELLSASLAIKEEQSDGFGRSIYFAGEIAAKTAEIEKTMKLYIEENQDFNEEYIRIKEKQNSEIYALGVKIDEVSQNFEANNRSLKNIEKNVAIIESKSIKSENGNSNIKQKGLFSSLFR
ncbi:hypothetical protein [Sulfurimonas sp.]|uniref:hypothetical protein n=1 Tax=Sulfurimonas sp. TaxID=2022749 RepID=UPI0025E0C1A2|nr:hypothetical protein [Sulfurimonas sp.]